MLSVVERGVGLLGMYLNVLFVTVTSNAGPSLQQQALRTGRRIVQAAR
jgi:hypothetical protein